MDDTNKQLTTDPSTHSTHSGQASLGASNSQPGDNNSTGDQAASQEEVMSTTAEPEDTKNSPAGTEPKAEEAAESPAAETASAPSSPSTDDALKNPTADAQQKSADDQTSDDDANQTADGKSPKRPFETTSDDTNKAHWYVVHTYSGHEKKVANTLKQRIDSLKLKDKILDILIPTQDKIEIKEGKKSTVKEKIFPGYLLVNMIMDDNSWLAVRTTPGITGFIGTSTKPTPLPEEEVKTIRRYMTMAAPKFKTTFTEGEAIKITDGPFSEFLGTISELDEAKGKLKVLVSVFGRETPVELDFLQVAKL